MCNLILCFYFFFNDTATTEIYTLSLHDALPISREGEGDAPERRGARHLHLAHAAVGPFDTQPRAAVFRAPQRGRVRSEEHTSELQSRQYLVCRLLLEKKKKIDI